MVGVLPRVCLGCLELGLDNVGFGRAKVWAGRWWVGRGGRGEVSNAIILRYDLLGPCSFCFTLGSLLILSDTPIKKRV